MPTENHISTRLVGQTMKKNVEGVLDRVEKIYIGRRYPTARGSKGNSAKGCERILVGRTQGICIGKMGDAEEKWAEISSYHQCQTVVSKSLQMVFLTER